MKGEESRIYAILLEIKEDLGEIKAEQKSIKSLAEATEKTVKKHDTIITNWQGRLAMVGIVAGVISTSVIGWIKKELGMDV